MAAAAIEPVLPIFYGEPKLDKIRPKDFLALLTKLVVPGGWAEADALRRINIALQGDAGKWFKYNTTQMFRTNITTMAQFYTAFKAQFYFDATVEDARYPIVDKIIQKQDETVNQFEQRINYCLLYTSDAADE